MAETILGAPQALLMDYIWQAGCGTLRMEIFGQQVLPPPKQ